MEQLISIIIFTTPGLLVYFWIQAFGLSPVVKHTPMELAVVASLFWIPTVLLMVITYDLLYLMIDLILVAVNWDVSALNMKLIENLSDIQESSTNIVFVIIFFILSTISSLVVARIWVIWYDKYILKFINDYRLKRKLVKLSDTTTVWDSFFHKLKTDKEESLVVEIHKIDKPEIRLVGSVTKMSRPYEMERALVLEHIEDWTNAITVKEFKKERLYVDIKSGIIVTELNQTEYKIISWPAEAPAEVEQPGDQQNADDD